MSDHAPRELSIGEPVGMDAVREDWTRLAFLSGRVFSTYEWAAAWWHEYGHGRDHLILPLRDTAGTVSAILPLYIHQRWPLRIARFIGHGAGDELGPVCAPTARPVVAKTLLASLRAGDLPADLLLSERLPAIEGWDRLMNAAVLRQVGNPAIVFETNDWDEYLRALNSHLRQRVRYSERRLRRERQVNFRMASDPTTLSDDLETFFSLHGARWGSASSLLKRQQFYRRFAAAALQQGWLRLGLLEIDGAAAAASLDFRYGTTQFQYSLGRDPRWDRLSAGFVLRLLSMREALMDGVKEYRLLIGDEEYKWRFATVDRGSQTIVVPSTAVGRLATASARLIARSGRGRRLLNRAGA